MRNKGSLESLHNYHHPGSDNHSIVHRTSESLGYINCTWRQKRSGPIVVNPFDGVFYVPVFNIGLQSDTSDASF